MISDVSILGVSFDKTSLKETISTLAHAAKGKDQLFCVTPNPEICLSAQKDSDFCSLLNEADLSLPDGFGILWAARYQAGRPSLFRWIWTLLTPGKTRKHSPLPHRVTGSDVVRELCHQHKDLKYFLLGASPEVNKTLSKKLRQKGVQVVGNFSGNDSKKLEPIIQSMVKSSEAEVLFVAFGAPRQEQWIKRNLAHMKSVKVAMGIGGSFDFLAGKRKRAPKWMQQWGLEWLYRLVIEPSRFKRIFNATVVFPIKVYVESRKKNK